MPEVTQTTDSVLLRAIYNGDPSMEFGRSRRFTIIGPVSINDDISNNIFVSEVYPNPVINHASIDIYLTEPAAITISVVDISGSECTHTARYSNKLAGNDIISIDLAGLVSGSYYLLIEVRAGSVVRTLVREFVVH